MSKVSSTIVVEPFAELYVLDGFAKAAREIPEDVRRAILPTEPPSVEIRVQKQPDGTFVVDGIVRIPVDSKAIAVIGYDQETQTLEITYQGKDGKPGAVYQYAAVPLSVYQELMAAESKGQFVATNIKGVYAPTRIQ